MIELHLVEALNHPMCTPQYTGALADGVDKNWNHALPTPTWLSSTHIDWMKCSPDGFGKIGTKVEDNRMHSVQVIIRTARCYTNDMLEQFPMNDMSEHKAS